MKIDHDSRGLVSHGLSTCAGCGMEIIMRKVLDVMGKDTIVIIPPGCGANFSGVDENTGIKIPGFQGNLGNSAACATGVRVALNALGNSHTHVLVFAGDGATVDIGLQSLSGALERQDRIIYICYDNEAYMNTGIQGSGSTPYLSYSSTTPAGKLSRKKDLIEIVIAHGAVYAATASIAYLKDLQDKVLRAKTAKGPSVLHVLTPCPTGWGYDPKLSIQLARSAVKTGSWILYEYDNGDAKINVLPKELEPIKNYIGLQGRFNHLDDNHIDELQNFVRDNFKRKVRLINCYNEVE